MSLKNTHVILILGIIIKLLLIPGYFSTDYDVHRNWLRITHNQPLQQWYVDDKSIWTLDYPPLFAYFEWLLAQPATILCPQIISSDSLHCHSSNCVIYHRLTVIISQFVFYLAVKYALERQPIQRQSLVVFSTIFLQFGFILLDDIHFQYNSMMQGILIFSVQKMMDGQVIASAAIFSILLNFKHIYLYVAPVYFLYILAGYVKMDVLRLFKVAVVTILPFIVAFGPFVISGGWRQIGIILARLFPFQRGLVHSYWAPNAWALYFMADRVLGAFGMPSNAIQGTGQNYSSTLRVLPDISAGMTLILILIVSLPIYYICFIRTWKNGMNKYSFPFYIILSGLIFFFLGYHVHQKAITIYINLALLYFGDSFWPETLVNSVNLFPLLISPKQKFIKILGSILYLSFWGKQHRNTSLGKIVISSAAIIVFFHEMIHPFMRGRMEFLPLMMNSVWAATWNLLMIARMCRRLPDSQHKYII